jgi:hypothetical protein
MYILGTGGKKEGEGERVGTNGRCGEDGKNYNSFHERHVIGNQGTCRDETDSPLKKFDHPILELQKLPCRRAHHSR